MALLGLTANSFAVDPAECPFSTTFTNRMRKSSELGPSHDPPGSINEGHESPIPLTGGSPQLPIQPKMKML
jgi:hypothetical protein